jgi:hypothetical protein
MLLQLNDAQNSSFPKLRNVQMKDGQEILPACNTCPAGKTAHQMFPQASCHVVVMLLGFACLLSSNLWNCTAPTRDDREKQASRGIYASKERNAPGVLAILPEIRFLK